MAVNNTKKNPYEGLKRDTIKTTLRHIAINTAICTVIFLLLLIDMEKELLYKALIGFLIIVLISLLCFIKLGYSEYKNEKESISLSFVKEKLTPGFYMEVFPRKNHFMIFREFFYREIPKKGKYYAKSSNSTELVRIYIKLDYDDEYMILEKIQSKKFLDCYRLIEEIGTID